MPTYKELFEQARTVEELLIRYGVRIDETSQFKRSLRLLETEYQMSCGILPVNPNEVHSEFEHILRDSMGFSSMCKRILRAEREGRLAKFTHLLKKQAGAIFSQAVKYADIEDVSPREQMESNKLFELVVGLAADEIGTDLDMEGTKTSHPDVMVTVAGVRWALPCKVAVSRKMESVFRLVEEGIEQIKRRSDVQHGCVVLNLRNVFDVDLNPEKVHDNGYEGPLTVHGYENDDIDAKIRRWLARFYQGFRDVYGAEIAQSLFTSEKAVGGFLSYLEVAPLIAAGPGIAKSGSISVAIYIRIVPGSGDPPTVMALAKALSGHDSVPMQENSSIFRRKRLGQNQ